MRETECAKISKSSLTFLRRNKDKQETNTSDFPTGREKAWGWAQRWGKSDPDMFRIRSALFPQEMWTYSFYFLLFRPMTNKESRKHTHNRECSKS